MLFTRSQGKRTTCDCRQGEGDPSVQLYSGSVLVAHIDGTFLSVRVTTLCLKRTMSHESLSVGMFHRPSSIH